MSYKNGKITMEGRKDSVAHLLASLPGVINGSPVESISERIRQEGMRMG